MNKSKLVSNTQIYLDCRKLLDEILDITPNFPRAYKFSVGSKMHDIGVNLISEISAAYINRDKQTRIQHLVNFQSQFEVLKTLLRIAGERKWILGRSKHANIIELTDAIGKQSTAWNLNLNNGNANNNTKATNQNRVRPVSALFQMNRHTK